MNLKKILSKFGNFNPDRDCLVMVGADDRFAFYAPDRHSRLAESPDGIPTHVMIALSFMYLAANPEENKEIVEGLRERTVEWLHRSDRGEEGTV